MCQHAEMHPATIARILAVAAATWALLSLPVAIPPAAADPCPFSEVVFARGTGEPPGVGGTGEAFIDALRSQVPGRTIEVYPVNYPASPDYRASATAGAEDRARTWKAPLRTAPAPAWCSAVTLRARP
jgi:cutinase